MQPDVVIAPEKTWSHCADAEIFSSRLHEVKNIKHQRSNTIDIFLKASRGQNTTIIYNTCHARRLAQQVALVCGRLLYYESLPRIEITILSITILAITVITAIISV